MTSDIVPQPFDFNKPEVRRITIDGEDWFHLVDFCKSLGISESQARNYSKTLPKASVRQTDARNSRGELRPTSWINKNGISYILQTSRKPIPKAIQDWLANIVLLEIGETGGYVAPWITTEQLARIQERLDYKQLLNIIAGAEDYVPSTTQTKYVFSKVQNMFYLILLGQDAKQIRDSREIVTWEGKRGPTKNDLKIAKNYLEADELEFMGINLTYVLTKFRKRFYKKPYCMSDVMRVVEDGLKEE